jgi:hypothetical protein
MGGEDKGAMECQNFFDRASEIYFLKQRTAENEWELTMSEVVFITDSTSSAGVR